MVNGYVFMISFSLRLLFMYRKLFICTSWLFILPHCRILFVCLEIFQCYFWDYLCISSTNKHTFVFFFPYFWFIPLDLLIQLVLLAKLGKDMDSLYLRQLLASCFPHLGRFGLEVSSYMDFIRGMFYLVLPSLARLSRVHAGFCSRPFLYLLGCSRDFFFVLRLFTWFITFIGLCVLNRPLSRDKPSLIMSDNLFWCVCVLFTGFFFFSILNLWSLWILFPSVLLFLLFYLYLIVLLEW